MDLPAQSWLADLNPPRAQTLVLIPAGPKAGTRLTVSPIKMPSSYRYILAETGVKSQLSGI